MSNGKTVTLLPASRFAGQDRAVRPRVTPSAGSDSSAPVGPIARRAGPRVRPTEPPLRTAFSGQRA